MNKLHEMLSRGQSVWLDHIRRSLLTTGELEELIKQGLRGMTSNPTIFDQAISQSNDYREQIRSLVQQGKSEHEIYEALAIEDVQRAADQFHPIYQEANQAVDGIAPSYGFDGYVSLEANPHLAHDTAGTIEEVRRLHRAVGRPNVMFKIPATPEGIPAIEQLVGEGINVNVTLMFSVKHYEAVTEAYFSGLEKRVRTAQRVIPIASVASFFVSRMDSKLDPRLSRRNLDDLVGKIGIGNAKYVYHRFTEIFRSDRWLQLAEYGARVQRVLWGSTSTKNPDYPDTMYVDNLIGPQTVNTMPPSTLEAFMDHGTVERTVDQNLAESLAYLERLENAGINLIAIGDELQREGVEKFAKSYDDLLETIAEKREAISA